MKLVFLLSLFVLSAIADDIRIKDYQWTLTDIASKKITKEVLFTRMDRDFVIPSKSICSNRSHMWVNDFKKGLNLDTGKIFLFYTKKKGSLSLKTWWYHVAPVINENGKVWVMDAGFGDWINKPLSKEEWLLKFVNSNNCKEINANETELIELIFTGQAFPHDTTYGHYDCYFKIVPHTFWTPETVATNLLGRDRTGRTVRLERHEIDQNELYQACLEATTSPLGYATGTNKKECKAYAGLTIDD